MGIKIQGFMFAPTEPGKCHMDWRVYGTRKTFNYSDGRVAPLPGSWERLLEFRLKKSRGKVGFPAFELEPTDTGKWKFYHLVAIDSAGEEIWHDDSELKLPRDLPSEFEPPFDVPTWLLWNLERKGVIAPGQIRD